MAAVLDYTPGVTPVESLSAVPALAFSSYSLTPTADDGLLENVYYIDHLDHDSVVFQTIRPENPDWWLYPRQPDTISYEISLGATDIDGFSVVDYDFIAPFRTGWRLRCGAVTISEGWHTQVSSELGSDYMSVAGASWGDYFAHRQFPFDPRTTPDYAANHVNDFVIGTPPQGLSYESVNPTLATDISHIIKDVFDQIMGRPNSMPITYTRADLGYGIKYFSLSLGDTTDFLTILTTLSNTPPGFDFRVTPAKALQISSPYLYGNNTDIVAGGEDGPDLAAKFTDDNKGVFELTFTNTGPEKTHTLGTGAGTATNYGVALGTPDGNEAVYWRLDSSFDAGDLTDRDDIEQFTRQDFAYGLEPVHEIPLTVLPSVYNDSESVFWTTFKAGCAIWIRVDLGMHLINSPQRVISLHGSMGEDGNCIVEFGLNQIYDHDLSTVGVYEG